MTSLKHSITLTVALTVAIFGLLALVIVMLVEQKHFLRNGLEQFERRAQISRTDLSAMLRYHDVDALRTHLANLSADPFIDLALITDANNDIVYAANPVHETTNLARVTSPQTVATAATVRAANKGGVWPLADTDYLLAYYPLASPASPAHEQANMLIVRRSLAAEHKLARDHALIMFLLLLGMATLLGFFASRRLERDIVQPIMGLVATTHRVANGDLEARSDPRVGGEIGELARSLNDMTAALEKERRALQDTEQTLRLTHRFAKIITYEWDLRSDKLLASDYYFELLGRPKPDGPLPITEMVADTVHPEDLENLSGALTATRESGKPFDVIYRLQHANGSYRWLHTQGDIERDAAGQPFRVLGVGHDITREKVVQEQLRAALREVEYQKEALDLSTIVSIVDANGTISYVNERFLLTTGYTREEIVGTPHPLIDAEFHGAEFTETITSIIQQGRIWRGEIRNVGKDGDHYWMDLTIVPHVDSHLKPNRYVYIGTDITDRHLADLQLQEERNLFLTGPVVVFKWRNQSGWPVEYVSGNVEATLGVDKQALLSSDVYYDELIAADDRERVGNEVRSALDAQATIVTHQPYRIVDNNGATRWLFDHTLVLRGDDGDVTHFLGYVIDITNQRNTEIEHDALRVQLLQAQKMEAMGQLAGGVAHDFNNILTSIIGYADLARRRFVDDHDSKLSVYLHEITAAGDRGRDLVAKMLTFSRGGDSEEQVVLLDKIIEETRQLLRPMLPSSITLNVTIEPGLPSILGEPIQVQQVIMNLCINARDALNGAGKIAISAYQTTLSQRQCASCKQHFGGEYVVLAVFDSGEGIEPEIMERLFDPFFTTKAPGSGTGLGLSVVHGAVHHMRGHLLVDGGDAANGAGFEIYLPPRASATQVDGLHNDRLLAANIAATHTST